MLDTLGWVGRAKEIDLLLRWYEMQLLGLLGYRPELHRCLICKTPLEPDEGHAFSVQGGVICPTCAPTQRATSISLAAFKVLRLLQRSANYQEVDKVHVSDTISSEVKRILNSYVQYILERELRSAQFLVHAHEQLAVPTNS